MVDEYELVQRTVNLLRSTHDIEGYTIDSHTLRHIVAVFIESTNNDYDYAYKKVIEILNEMGYRVA